MRALGRPRRLILVSGLLALGSARASADQGTARPQCDATEAKGPTGIRKLACELASKLPVLPDVRVVTLPLSSAEEQQQARFGKHLSALVGSALGATDAGFATTIHEIPDTAPGDTRPLLLLEPRVQGGNLGVSANAISRPLGFWARVRGEKPRVLAHAYVEAALDVELRSYFPATPLVRPTVTAYPQPASHANAVACGDLDGDGALDVALADRRRIMLGYLTPEGYRTAREVSWSDLSEVASVPLREPLAALFIKNGILTASSSDRATSVKLNAALEVVQTQPGQLAVGPGLCVPRVEFTEQMESNACSSAAAEPSNENFQVLDRVVVFETAHAEPSRLTAWRDPHTATLELKIKTRRGEERLRYAGIGAEIAVGDLNLDGRAELIASTDTLDATRDELRLWSLQVEASGASRQARWSVPVQSGIQALGVCPPDNLGQAAILAVTRDSLLVIR